jgi:hypothetical protein
MRLMSHHTINQCTLPFFGALVGPRWLRTYDQTAALQLLL